MIMIDSNTIECSICLPRKLSPQPKKGNVWIPRLPQEEAP